MKKLSLYIFLVLMFCNVGFSNESGKIEDIKINGISIGDNLLDHFSKQELIQEKKLLEAISKGNKLFYTSRVKNWFFYYESNERVGMTEKPIYRIIGMEGVKTCNVFGISFNKDEIVTAMKECIENDKIKKHIHKLLSGPFLTSKSDRIVNQNGTLSYDIYYTSGGCYHDSVSVKFFSDLENSNEYSKPVIYFQLISLELDSILYMKYC